MRGQEAGRRAGGAELGAAGGCWGLLRAGGSWALLIASCALQRLQHQQLPLHACKASHVPTGERVCMRPHQLGEGQAWAGPAVQLQYLPPAQVRLAVVVAQRHSVRHPGLAHGTHHPAPPSLEPSAGGGQPLGGRLLRQRGAPVAHAVGCMRRCRLLCCKAGWMSTGCCSDSAHQQLPADASSMSASDLAQAAARTMKPVTMSPVNSARPNPSSSARSTALWACGAGGETESRVRQRGMWGMSMVWQLRRVSTCSARSICS